MSEVSLSHEMQSENGFTLVELLVAVAVVAILLGVAAPNFQSILRDTKQVSYYNKVASTVRYARSEAIKRSVAVSVCPRDTDVSCGNDWSNGLLVFDDAAINGNPGVLDGQDEVLRTIRLRSSDIELTASAIVRPANAPVSQTRVRFDSRGQANWTNGTWLLCDGRGAEGARALIMNGAGIGRRAYPSSTSGDVVVDARGLPVVCP